MKTVSLYLTLLPYRSSQYCRSFVDSDQGLNLGENNMIARRYGYLPERATISETAEGRRAARGSGYVRPYTIGVTSLVRCEIDVKTCIEVPPPLIASA